MKKVFLALIAVVAIGTSTSFAQKAIGLRFGGGSAFGAEVSYQQGMGSNRLEADFGFKPSTNLREGLRRFAEWYQEFYG